jgi:phage portal protein BeeE
MMNSFTKAVTQATLAVFAAQEALRQVQNVPVLLDAVGNPVNPVQRGVTPNLDPQFLRGTRISSGYSIVTSKPYQFHSWTYAAINRVMQPISALPRVLYDVNDEQKIFKEHEILELFLNPNPLMSGTDLWDYTLLNLLLPTAATPGGQCFWYLESGVKGKRVDLRKGQIPAEIWPYSDHVIKPRYHRHTKVLTGWKMVVGGKDVMEFEFGELIRIRLPNPYNPAQGMSPYTAAQIPVNLDMKADEFNTAFLDNFGAIGGLLTTENDTIDFEELRQYEEKWNEEYSGAGNAGRTVALAHGLKYEQFMRSNVDMQYMEQRTDNRLRIQAAYGVNEEEIGIYEKGMNRATAEQADRSVWQKTRIPLDERIWNSVNGKWIQYIGTGNLRGKSDKSNVEALQESHTEKVDTAHKMWQMDVPAAEAFRVAQVPIDVDAYPWLKQKFVPMTLIDIATLAEGFISTPGAAAEKPQRQHLLNILSNALQNKIERKELPVTKELVKEIEVASARENRKERQALWESYVRAVLDPGEKSMRTMFVRHSIRLRNEMLDNVDKWLKEQQRSVQFIRQLVVDPTAFLFDLALADEDLVRSYTPETAKQMKRELKKLKQDYGAVIQWSVTEDNVKKLVKARADKLHEVNTFTHNSSRKIVSKITTQAIEENWTPQQYAKALKTGIQQGVDKMTPARSIRFARTETGSISGMSRFDAFRASDIRTHEWLSAGDELVRRPPDSLFNHAIDGERQNVGAYFSNDLRYPLDPRGQAGNVINCRCVALPIVED